MIQDEDFFRGVWKTAKNVTISFVISVCLSVRPSARKNSDTFFFFFFLRRYNFREVLAFSTSFFHLVRFLMQSFQSVIFILVISLLTSSSHLFLGLPSDLVSAGDHSYTFLPCCYLAYDVRVRTKLIFVLWNSDTTKEIFMKLIFANFSKICRENSSFIKICQK